MKEELIKRLESLKRYDISGGSNPDYEGTLHYDNNGNGNWVQWEDIEKIIQYLKNNETL